MLVFACLLVRPAIGNGQPLPATAEASLFQFHGRPVDAGAWLSWQDALGSGEMMIRHSPSTYPVTQTDGSQSFRGPILPGQKDSVLVNGLANGQRWYFSLFSGSGSNFVRVDTTSAVPLNLRVHYVDPNGANIYPYASLENAARTITLGLSVVSPGDTLYIAPHVYAASGQLESVSLRPGGIVLGLGGRPSFGAAVFENGFSGSAVLRELRMTSLGCEASVAGSSVELSGCEIAQSIQGPFGHQDVYFEGCTLGGDLSADFAGDLTLSQCSVQGTVNATGQGTANLAHCTAGAITVSFYNTFADSLQVAGALSLSGGTELFLKSGETPFSRRASTVAIACQAASLSIHGDTVIAADCTTSGGISLSGEFTRAENCVASAISLVCGGFGGQVFACRSGSVQAISDYSDLVVEGCEVTGLIDLTGGPLAAIRDCPRVGSVRLDASASELVLSEVRGPAWVGASARALVNRCTIVGPGQAGLTLASFGFPEVTMSANIVTGFTQGVVVSGGPAPAITCNDVWNNGAAWVGVPNQTNINGNFSRNPVFCDPVGRDYRLDITSPCIPGHHPLGTPCGVIGRYGQGCDLFSAVDDTVAASSHLTLHPGHPNPSRGVTALSFELASPGEVELSLYDAGGRRVRTLIRRDLPAGVHEAAWDGRDEAGRQVSSGVYLARLRASGSVRTARLVLSR